jgi:hypothetical protein
MIAKGTRRPHIFIGGYRCLRVFRAVARSDHTPGLKVFMKNTSHQRLLAERLFMPIVSSAGASSLAVPSATTETKEKSARLKALRLARDAEQRVKKLSPV